MGSPLYLGEIPQQASSGFVTGLSLSRIGALPAIMIFGILGATPQWQAADSEVGFLRGM